MDTIREGGDLHLYDKWECEARTLGSASSLPPRTYTVEGCQPHLVMPTAAPTPLPSQYVDLCVWLPLSYISCTYSTFNMEGKRGMPPSLTPRPWCGSGSDPQHKEGCGGKAKRRSKWQGKRGVRWRKQNWESYRCISRNLIGLVVAWRGRLAHDGGWLSVQAKSWYNTVTFKLHHIISSHTRICSNLLAKHDGHKEFKLSSEPSAVWARSPDSRQSIFSPRRPRNVSTVFFVRKKI